MRPRIVVAGGGTAGVTVAARLCRALDDPDVTVVEPSETHDYQPLWTLVGAGVVRAEQTRRTEHSVLPAKARWVHDAVAGFDPAAGEIELQGGGRLGYDALVVALGLRLDWEAIAGMSAAQLGRDGVCSNYTYEGCQATWRTLQAFGGGTALFTYPRPPVKCGGAAQKIMYLADEHLRRRGVRDASRVVYAATAPGIFPVPEFARTLDGIVARKGIETRFEQELVEVRAAERTAVLAHVETGAATEMGYDMLHVVPPQRPPAVVEDSALAGSGGWVDVDRHTLRHARHANVFALGDCSSLPTGKTGAAVRKQAPVLVHNLLATLRGAPEATFKRYDGYSSCPLVTGYGRLILAEFDYDMRPAPSFPFDTTKERRSMYLLKRYGLPELYWHGMLKGRV